MAAPQGLGKFGGVAGRIADQFFRLSHEVLLALLIQKSYPPDPAWRQPGIRRPRAVQSARDGRHPRSEYRSGSGGQWRSASGCWALPPARDRAVREYVGP